MLTIPTERDLTLLRSNLAPEAKSQNLQDVFVLSILERLVNGYFVEVGAANGVQFSNTYLLEKKFGWTGILVEPSLAWHPSILACRQATLDKRCAWSTDGKIQFCQLPDSNLSTAEKYAGDQLRTWRTSPTARYEVEAATLQTILREAPPVIDYLSLDTEGSEWEVLSAYDFSHPFRVITCEHNYQEQKRSQIHQLLAARGYQRVCEAFSKFDDWYVNTTLVGERP